MTDAEFERELYGLFGEASEGSPDGGVTDRILRDVARRDRLRAWVLGAAVSAGAAAGAVAGLALAGPSLERLALQAGAPAQVVWLAVPMTAIFMGWAALRVALDS